MYSFVLHTHQKIDRVAYHQLGLLVGGELPFTIKQVLHYEGRRGPDAARLKKGDSDPPWHFYQPNGDNTKFLATVQGHYTQLVHELKVKNMERAAFEAAWLAHALVDGLTPAHHFPYEDELLALRLQMKDTRETVRSHLFVRGENSRQTMKRSFQLIGPKGLLTTHTTFEAGAAMIILPQSFSKSMPSADDIELAKTSLIDCFEQYVREVGNLHMYERFYRRGWTQALARNVRRDLAPRMVQMVTLAWYSALVKAGLVEASDHANN